MSCSSDKNPAYKKPATDDVLAEVHDLYRDLNLKIEMIPIGQVRGYKRNARTHSPAQIQQIAQSIKSFGFVVPLMVEADGTLIAGHGRVAAADLLGYKFVPGVYLSHLTDAKKRALRLADNKIAAQAGWDEKLLALEFNDLLQLELSGEISFDLTVTGFTSPEIDYLVDAVQPSSDAKDEVIPELQADPVSRLGDIFDLGDHRIICGDARDRAAYEALLGNERAAVSANDSPYNVSIENHVGSQRHSEFVMGVGEMDAAQFTGFIAEFLGLSRDYCKPGAIHYAFMDWRHMGEMLDAGRQSGLELKNLCVWAKSSAAMGSFYRSQHELVFVFKEPSASHINNVQLGKFGRDRSNVWSYPGAASLRKELKLHPTPKIVAMIADAIRDASNRNDIVLDAFSGSGTTIIAAAKTGRRARVIERDPHYVDVAIRRWEAWSGGTARHTATGMSFAELATARGSEASADKATSAGAKAVRVARVRRRSPSPVGSE